MNQASHSTSFARGGHLWISALLLLVGAGAACTASPEGGGTGGARVGSGGVGSGGSGTSQTGGATGSGGSSSTGGATGSGGTSSTGGATGSGGSSSTGGKPGSGGASSTGGATGSGGANGSGGASGGTVGGAGRGGGGTGGGGPGGGSGGGAGAGCAFKFCEDFEKGTEGGIPTGWTALKGFGPAEGVGLASDEAHSGKMSVKSSTMATGAQRIQMNLASFGATATKHWGRLYYKAKMGAPRAMSSSAYYHVTFAALQGTTENRVVDSVEDPNGKIQYIFNLPDDSCCTGSSYDWTYDGNWHCAEWHVDVANQSYQFFIDTKEVTSIGFKNNAQAKMSNYTALAIGAIFYVTPTGPWTSWIDDIAINDAQIGCD